MKFLVIPLIFIAFPAWGACTSVTVGQTTFYNCEGKLTTEQRTGPYTTYQPRFPASAPRNFPAKPKRAQPNRPAFHIKQQPYDWQRHSK